MNDRFGDIAIAAGCITRSQLEEALLFQRLSVDYVPLGRLLYDMKYISLENVKWILAIQRASSYQASTAGAEHEPVLVLTGISEGDMEEFLPQRSH